MTKRRIPFSNEAREAIKNATAAALFEALHDVTGYGMSEISAYVRDRRWDEVARRCAQVWATLTPEQKNAVVLREHALLTSVTMYVYSDEEIDQ